MVQKLSYMSCVSATYMEGDQMASAHQVLIDARRTSTPYCSDPTCLYCKDLRDAEERLSLQAQSEQQSQGRLTK